MNSESKALFDLIKSALTGEKVAFSSEINLEKIIKIARLHQIAPIIFYGLKNSGLKTPYDDILFEITGQHIIIEQQQLGIIEEIKTAFSENNIDFAFLKGSRLKNIYPKSEMRVMGDIDVLINPAQYTQIREILLELNFTEKFQWDYECHWQKNGINIEVHKHFNSNNGEKLYAFFGDIWQKLKAEKQNKNSFVMTKEDEYIYIFAHLTRHYRTGGIGLRQFVDVYAFGLKHPQLDMTYVENALKQLGYFEFYQNVIKTLDCWFNGAKMDDTIKTITLYTIKSGLFGTSENNDMALISDSVKKSGSAKKAKVKAFLSAVFPSVAMVNKRFRILKKAPWLLPAVWVIRWISAIFKPQKIRNNTKRLKNFSAETVAEFDSKLKKVGL